MRQPFRRASVYTTLLLILEVIAGFLIIIVTAVYQTILSSYLEENDRRLLFSSLFNIYLFGVQLVVTFLCSVSLWNRLWKRRCTPNVRLMLSVWLFYSCVIIVSGLGTILNLYYHKDVLESSAESSLLRGIDEYYASPEWKLLWDGLQLRRQCCGVYSYKDWMNAEWIPKQLANSSGRHRVIFAPIACSKRDCSSVVPNYIARHEDDHTHHGPAPVPMMTIDSINTSGCLSVYSDCLLRFIYTVLLLALTSLKFLIIMCCLTKCTLQRQNMGDGGDNVGLVDEDGRPLITVKYPRNVRCITLAEDDLASDMAPEAIYCNCDELGESWNNCENN